MTADFQMLRRMEELVYHRVPMRHLRRCRMQLRLGNLVLREEHSIDRVDLAGLRLHTRHQLRCHRYVSFCYMKASSYRLLFTRPACLPNLVHRLTNPPQLLLDLQAEPAPADPLRNIRIRDGLLRHAHHCAHHHPPRPGRGVGSQRHSTSSRIPLTSCRTDAPPR